jgi:hypothetical protein
MKTIDELNKAKHKAENDIKNILDSLSKEYGEISNLEIRYIFESLFETGVGFVGFRSNVKIKIEL